MWKLEELKRVYQEYEKEYQKSDLPEDKQMNYNYIILGCIKYHDITLNDHIKVLEEIGAKSPMSIFNEEYNELTDLIENETERANA